MFKYWKYIKNFDSKSAIEYLWETDEMFGFSIMLFFHWFLLKCSASLETTAYFQFSLLAFQNLS